MHLNVCTENVMSIGQGILRGKLILGNVLENCMSELRCNTHSFSTKPLCVRSLNLDLVSTMTSKELGSKNYLWFIVWIGVAAEIRTEMCNQPMPWLRTEGSIPPLPCSDSSGLSLLLLPWRFSFQLHKPNPPFRGRPGVGSASCKAHSYTVTSATQLWAESSVLRTDALWAR